MAAPISRDAAGACRALAGTAPRSSASVCGRTESVYRHAPSRLSLGTAPVLLSSLRCRKSLFFPWTVGAFRGLGWLVPGCLVLAGLGFCRHWGVNSFLLESSQGSSML